jgi:hypothetical protein
MTFWVAGAVVGSSLIGANAASSAASTQANAANRAADISNEQYQQTRQDQMPWMQAGQRALSKLETAADYTPFGMGQFTQDPGYAFRMKEGMNALNANAAARGGLISGNALRAAQAYGQDLGSQEYQNAFNRYQIERNAKLAPLQSLAGVGQTTAQQLGAAGAANAGAVGNYLTGGAAAQAAGQVGGANAITSGLGTYLNYNQGNNLLSALRGGGGGGGSIGYGSGYAGGGPTGYNP